MACIKVDSNVLNSKPIAYVGKCNCNFRDLTYLFYVFYLNNYIYIEKQSDLSKFIEFIIGANNKIFLDAYNVLKITPINDNENHIKNFMDVITAIDTHFNDRNVGITTGQTQTNHTKLNQSLRSVIDSAKSNFIHICYYGINELCKSDAFIERISDSPCFPEIFLTKINEYANANQSINSGLTI